jgi:hypothetical protein
VVYVVSMGDVRIEYKVLVGNPDGNSPLERILKK